MSGNGYVTTESNSTWTTPTTISPTIFPTWQPHQKTAKPEDSNLDIEERIKKIELSIHRLDKKMEELIEIAKIIKSVLINKGITEIADLL